MSLTENETQSNDVPVAVPQALDNPATVTARRDADGRLFVIKDGTEVEVRVCCCFPWSQPGRYLSLRDEKDNEVLLLPDLGGLDAGSRRAVADALREAGFLFEIVAVESVEEEFELRNWKATTRQGAYVFQTKLDAWPWSLPGGGLLIRDITGNLFCLPDPSALDPKSRKVLWAFLD